ncbi:MAG: carbamoyl phosphate synthase large subunit, partial [Candidatus Omnitrophota bacterium]|nr:carbamoyl phosphate synthase large subunit [Candidatus Omnitrophota bacterium]
FKEALQKGIRSLEIKKFGLESILFKDLKNVKADNGVLEKVYQKLRIPNAERLFYIGDALRLGSDIEKIYELTKIDRWFLHNIKEIIDLERAILENKNPITREALSTAKEFGFSDRQLAALLNKTEEEVYNLRKSLDVNPTFKLVDTCAAEFQAHTPYYYSTYES